MAFGFFRTVWISLRAVNYTTRAFQDTITNLKKTERSQVRFALSAKRNMMAVGMMYIAFGGIAVQTLSRIITASKYGERMMTRFGRRVSKSIGKLGETMARMIEPYLDFLTKILEIVTAIPIFRKVISYVLLLGTAFLFVKGTVKVLRGVLGILQIQQWANILMTKSHQTALTNWTGSAVTATGATKGFTLAIAGLNIQLNYLFAYLGAVIGALQIVISVMNIIKGKGKGADWGRIIGGVLGAIGGFLIGGPFGAAVGLGIGTTLGGAIGGEFQMGTAFVRKGGLAVVHAGEEIKSAREGGIKSDWGRRWETRQEFSKRIWNVTINMGDVYTKADKETMIPLVKRALKEELEKKV